MPIDGNSESAFFGTPCMNMRGESERHFEPISYLIEAQLCLKVGLWKLAKVLRFMFGRAETASRQFITAGTQQAACLQERKAQICLMRKMGGRGLEKDAEGSSEKYFFPGRKNVFLQVGRP